MNIKIIGIALIVIVLVVAAALVLKTKDTVKTNTVTTNPTPTTTESVMEEKSNTTSVTVTDNGYEPKTITIKKGDRVRWTNQSGTQVTVSSDAHPTHLLWPFLNLGSFEQGETVSVIFEKTGTYTYHNHFNSSQVGSVTVE